MNRQSENGIYVSVQVRKKRLLLMAEMPVKPVSHLCLALSLVVFVVVLYLLGHLPDATSLLKIFMFLVKNG